MNLFISQCLILGEITTQTLLVALNKTDLLPGSGPGDGAWEAALKSATDKLRAVLSKTAFAGASIVPLCAAPGGAGKAGAAGEGAAAATGDVSAFAAQLLHCMPLPRRSAAAQPFVFAVDHCFSVKGHGTVLTGTAIAGQARPGDTLQLPAIGFSGKLKSAQVFHKAVSVVKQGDRAGICLPGVPAEAVERGLLCAPGAVRGASTLVALVRKVRYFKGNMLSHSKCHVSIGHNTVVGTVDFAGAAELAEAGVTSGNALDVAAVPAGCMYAAQSALVGKRPGLVGKPAPGDDGAAWQWAVIQLEAPVLVPDSAVIIGSRLDAEATSTSCRLAWFGRVLQRVSHAPSTDGAPLLGELLHVYRNKHREGVVDRINKGGLRGLSIIGKDLFHKETDMHTFTGMQVALQLPPPAAGTSASAAVTAGAASSAATSATGSDSVGDQHQPYVLGTLLGPFGKTGKFKAEFQGPVYIGDPCAPWSGGGTAVSPAGDTLADGAWQPLVAAGMRMVLPFRKRLFVHGGAGGRKQMLQGKLQLPTWSQLAPAGDYSSRIAATGAAAGSGGVP